MTTVANQYVCRQAYCVLTKWTDLLLKDNKLPEITCKRHNLASSATFYSVSCNPQLTLCHGLEIHLAAVASEPSHSTCPHLEDVNSPRLEAADDGRVGLTFHNGWVMLSLILKRKMRKGGKKRWGKTFPFLNINIKHNPHGCAWWCV